MPSSVKNSRLLPIELVTMLMNRYRLLLPITYCHLLRLLAPLFLLLLTFFSTRSYFVLDYALLIFLRSLEPVLQFGPTYSFYKGLSVKATLL